MLNKIGKVASKAKLMLRGPKHSFISSHWYLSDKELIEASPGELKSSTLRSRFEDRFSGAFVDGRPCFAVASGRMALMAILESIGLVSGDEVILQSATCSVVASTVIRSGGIPVYVDLDPKTLGASKTEIIKALSDRTKAVIVQNSFGIAANIDGLYSSLRGLGIFLIEDCALAVGSSRNGEKVGTRGDFSFFSLDHSKPLNCMVGGMLVVNRDEFVRDISAKVGGYAELPLVRQESLFRQLRYERVFFRKGINRVGVAGGGWLPRVLFGVGQECFFKDPLPFGLVRSRDYCYRMPLFGCYLGMLEIDKFLSETEHKINLLNMAKRFFSERNLKSCIPEGYFDSCNSVIPHRIVIYHSDGSYLKKRLSCLVDERWMWFSEPLVAREVGLENFHFHWGCAPWFEENMTKILNLPANISVRDFRDLLNCFGESYATKNGL